VCVCVCVRVVATCTSIVVVVVGRGPKYVYLTLHHMDCVMDCAVYMRLASVPQMRALAPGQTYWGGWHAGNLRLLTSEAHTQLAEHMQENGADATVPLVLLYIVLYSLL
jgi:hypothetical protein